MFAVIRKDEQGDLLVVVRETEVECRAAATIDALVRLARTSPTFRRSAQAVGAGARPPESVETLEVREHLARELPRYVVERIG